MVANLAQGNGAPWPRRRPALVNPPNDASP